MAKKRPTRRNLKNKNKPISKRRRWIVWGLLSGVVLFGLYLFYLDVQVRSHFEGKRWALPAKVYARPLELHVGRPLKSDQLQAELDAMGYLKRAKLTQAGVYWRTGNRFAINSRAFQFPEGMEPGQRIDIELFDDRVESLWLDGASAPTGLARLDPAQIGSFYPAHNEDRILVKLTEVPHDLIKSLVVVEDRSFAHHWGVDLKGIARAMWANMRAGAWVQGGSTLTQQLAKNFYLSSERSLLRKINEAFMALLLELHYEKREILGAYINEVYLGQQGRRAIHGFGLASEFYFGRPLRTLPLEKTALLVAIVKGPSYYNPYRHPERARKRRDLVLQMLAEFEVVSYEAAQAAMDEPLGLVEQGRASQRSYPAYLDLVRRQLREHYRSEDLTSEGLRVFTNFDPGAQWALEQAVEKRLPLLKMGEAGKQLQIAGVVISRENGEVAALVGDRNPRYRGFNRVLDAVRPIGSLIKPAVYLAALAQPDKYHLYTPIEDKGLRIRGPAGDVWEPQNYDKVIHGPVPLQQALIHSYNLATVRLGMTVGVANVLDLLYRLGVDRKLDPYPSLFLGAAEMTPMNVAQFYQTLAAGGFYSPLGGIRAVVDAKGTLLQGYPVRVEQTVAPEPVYLVNRVLQAVAREGTAKGVQAYLPVDYQVAGKTGTTDDLRDSWFAGFTQDYLAVVWVGRDDNRPTGLSGSSGAMQVWGETMSRLAQRPLDLLPPANITTIDVDPTTGLQLGEGCSGGIEMAVVADHLPQRSETCNNGGGWFERLFQ